jgi:N-acyl-D-aspartate/D-glutamate deacylase
VGRRSLKDQPEFLELIDKMRKEGVRAQFDIYNELKGVSVITVILPTWYQGMSEEERNKPLTKLKLRALIKATSLLLGFGYDDIEVAYIGPGYEKYEGKTVHQLAKEYKKSDLDMYLQLCRESNFQGRVNMGPYTTEEIIHDFENNELCLYMTDAWVEEHGIQNPAIYDCFPKFLQDSLRGDGDVMPKTINRMTGATAERFMIKNRGYLRPGYFADITVFDEKVLKESERDRTCSFGIDRVFINGKEVMAEGNINKDILKNAGRAIRV